MIIRSSQWEDTLSFGETFSPARVVSCDFCAARQPKPETLNRVVSCDLSAARQMPFEFSNKYERCQTTSKLFIASP